MIRETSFPLIKTALCRSSKKSVFPLCLRCRLCLLSCNANPSLNIQYWWRGLLRDWSTCCLLGHKRIGRFVALPVAYMTISLPQWQQVINRTVVVCFPFPLSSQNELVVCSLKRTRLNQLILVEKQVFE
ncbi:Hypothetical protein, putative [Bodo saltans]|uniref:Uncharacterized protein n=1 Tax=Bodo saltans TaxID=75058 RepID=A0A0S4JLN6_BODSA|nr:Hypothetical protein, putative [Bodo saltans]|eukprot:CUG90172.1 Hypothetical protein, putative [Bodo saltans]